MIFPIPDGTQWTDTAGNLWTVNGDGVSLVSVAVGGALSAYQVVF